MNTNDGNIAIRLLIFSGRPDPEWFLDDASVVTLRERVEETTNGERIDTAPHGGLGYRGFLIQNHKSVPGLPEEFTVFRGVLSNPGSTSPGNWPDNGDVEGWLLSQARERGHGNTLDAFGAV